jgi:hypothetical protein
VTSPVLQALENARVKEQAAEERTLTAKVRERLGMPKPQGDLSHWSTWHAWCDQRNIAPFPALPASIAVYVLNCAELGTLEKVIGSVSALHQAEGKADPTLSPVVIEALNAVLPPIEPPRSWPATRKQEFTRLPRDLRGFVAEHHRNIETQLRRAQNVAAAKQKENHDGNLEQESTAAASADRTDAVADRTETPDRSGGSREAREATPA